MGERLTGEQADREKADRKRLTGEEACRGQADGEHSDRWNRLPGA